MRLIDADAQVIVQSYDPMNEEYSHDEMSVADALDFATDEGCPPTIDANPVEWLRNVHKNWILTRDDMEFRDWLIEKWQKEQEEQDG